MDSERWEEIKRLFGGALEVEPWRRIEWLEDECPDAALRREVLDLLEESETSTQFLETPACGGGRALEGYLAPLRAGQMLGPYRLVKELGHGGMGVVFEAEREGADFQQRVAIKIIRSGVGVASLEERFRLERRVLARLNHPGIARLLDGGATAAGTPYLVMEYVRGKPLDVWCSERAPGLKTRVELMVAACRAVEHAHQNLVIHRDLKPSNILVDVDGHIKLLDFGIAKIVAEETGADEDFTRTGMYLLTPDYASPEQIRGEAVTTVSDVYSLGVLLYGLLAGRKPYEWTGQPGLEALRQVLETEPPPPSARAPAGFAERLRGDLDNIVMKCLRKDPRERYGSARALADDLEAWLAGREVAATAPTLGYRLRKFVRRHRVEAAAGAALLLSVLGGTVATLWQAREAARERDRAQARFRDVQKLSRSLLFEIHKAVSQLPGATETRALILQRATEFLDSLARDAGSDTLLRAELADGYRRLGDVLGSDFSDNLGRKREALAVLAKGESLVREAALHPRNDGRTLSLLISILQSRAMLEFDLGQQERASATAQEIEQLTARLQERHAADPKAQASAAVHLSQLGMIRSRQRDYGAATELYQRALAVFANLPEEVAGDESNLEQRGFVHKRLGAQLIVKGELEGARRQYLQAVEIDRKLLARSPHDRQLKYNFTFGLADLGFIANRQGNHEEAQRLYAEVAQIRDLEHAADPKNRRVLGGAANAHCNLAETLGKLRRFEQAQAEMERCVALRTEQTRNSEEPSDCWLPSSAFLSRAGLLYEEGKFRRKPELQRRARETLQQALQQAAVCPGRNENFEAAARQLQSRISGARQQQ